jgi:pentatricopeptide repeat domain-containing protein 1
VQPDVITYSALISACEKGAQWQRAMEVFKEMKTAGVKPDDITYSALISACEKGAQWQRAMEVFKEMKAAGVKPDAITYSALISACEKGAQWQRAMEVFKEMKAAGVQPNRPTFNPLINVLWRCGQRRTAVDLYTVASQAGVYPLQAERTLNKIDLHNMSAGAAQAATTLWLAELAAASLELLVLPATFSVVTGQGNHKAGESEVKDTVTAFLLEELGSPFQAPRDNPGRLKANQLAACKWLGALGPINERVYSVGVPPLVHSVQPCEVEVSLDAMTVAQLRHECKRRGLSGYSGLLNAELIALLSIVARGAK